ncbi:MAG: NACHT domain-containing protein [Candidatus Wallbacteria bacterium]|nr:NACHT domain-containing protein [Candidatus Wallbacteria bacterium]
MPRRDAIAFSPQIDDALLKAARKGSGLTRVDREALAPLGAAFRSAPVLHLAALLAHLWPTADRKTALNRFHQLKRRFNTSGTGVVLCSPSDNSDPEAKEVWFESDRSPLERVIAQVAAHPEPERAGYSAELFSPRIRGRMPATLLTFPAEVVEFCESELAEAWRAFPEEARAFLASLSSRFMPMVQVVPPGCVACVRGFELLASGGRGEVYGELMRQAKALGVSLELLDAVLLLIQMLTVQELRRRTRYLPRYSGVYYSLNLSPPLLADTFRLARAVIRRFDEEERSALCFEMTEKFRLPEVRALGHLLREFGDLKFAVDDVNDHHLLTVARLGTYASFTKLSHRYVQDVLHRLPDDPAAGLADLLKHHLSGKPHVLEGVEDFELVKDIFEQGLEAGRVPRGVQIYAQGFGCALDSDWKPFLHVPAGFGWQGQYALPLRDTDTGPADAPPSSRPPTPRDFLGAIEDALRARGRQVARRRELPTGSGLFELTLDDRRVVLAATRGAGAAVSPDLELVIPDEPAAPPERGPGRRGHATGRKKGTKAPAAGPNAIRLGDFLARELAAAVNPPTDEERLVGRGLWRFSARSYYQARGHLERQSSGPAVETLMSWADEPAVPIAYLLGGYGSGKTFVARTFCQQVRQKIARTGRGRAPLYIDLKEVPEAVARTGNLEDVLRSGAAHAQLSEADWRHLAHAIRAGSVLLVIDGLDEKAGHLAEKGALHRFRRVLHSSVGPTSKVLVTSRLSVFADGATLLRETRVEELAASGRVGGADARLVELLPLTREERAAVLARTMPTGDIERIERLIATVPGLEDLASRPVALRWMADRGRELEQLLERRGKLACGPIFEAFASAWMARDEEKSVLVPQLKLAVMESLALACWRGGCWALSQEAAQKLVIAEVNAFYGGSPPADPARAAMADIRSAAFLTHDDTGSLRFAHAALAEFFLARRLAACVRDGATDALEGPALSEGARLFLASLAEGSEPAES